MVFCSNLNPFYQLSDERYKNNITDETLGLDFIDQLRPVKFRYNVERNQIVYTPTPRVDENGDPVFEQIPVLNENGEYTYDENGNQIFIDGPNQIIDQVMSIIPIPGVKLYHGLIAQEVDEVLTNNNLTTNDFPGLNKDYPERLSIGLTEFIAPVIMAIQELKARLELLEAV
jgi:hypothetical protein